MNCVLQFQFQFQFKVSIPVDPASSVDPITERESRGLQEILAVSSVLAVKMQTIILRKEAEKRKSFTSTSKCQMEFGETPAKMCPSPIMKLNIDCFHEVFDYLPLDDLISFGSTCKRLQIITGSFIQFSYVAKRKTGESNDVYMSWTPRQIGGFTRFIEKLSIFGHSDQPYRYIGANNFKCLKELRLAHVDLTDAKIEYIKSIFDGIETLELDLCRFNNNEFHKHFLQYCAKVKRLSVSRSSYDRDRATVIGSNNDWLQRHYPAMEHLELTDLYEFKSIEMKTFFAWNPNVHSFSTDAKSLLVNQHSFLNCGAKLDKLSIDFHHPNNINADIEPLFLVNVIYNLLNELYDQEFYKRLHLYITFIDHHNCIQKMFALKSLEMLSGIIIRIENPLMKLKELDISKGSDVTDLELFPIKFPELEQIQFAEATIDHMLPFIVASKKLKTIKINQLSYGTHLEQGVLDLFALNEKRKQLIKPRKVVIYANETVFLATKWASNELKFDLVELRRGESIDLEESNSRYKFVKSF